MPDLWNSYTLVLFTIAKYFGVTKSVLLTNSILPAQTHWYLHNIANYYFSIYYGFYHGDLKAVRLFLTSLTFNYVFVYAKCVSEIKYFYHLSGVSFANYIRHFTHHRK